MKKILLFLMFLLMLPLMFFSSYTLSVKGFMTLEFKWAQSIGRNISTQWQRGIFALAMMWSALSILGITGLFRLLEVSLISFAKKTIYIMGLGYKKSEEMRFRTLYMLKYPLSIVKRRNYSKTYFGGPVYVTGDAMRTSWAS